MRIYGNPTPPLWREPRGSGGAAGVPASEQTAPSSDPVRQAPRLPAGISRYPNWTTVPAAPSGLIDRGQEWSAETWRKLKSVMADMGKTSAPPTTGVAGYQTNTVASTSYSIYAAQVLQATNRERSIRGLPLLQAKFGLSYVGTRRSSDMIRRNYFEHVDPSGHDAFYYLRQESIRYRTGGENIAFGQQSPEEVVQAWMASPSHRANILNPNFNYLGVGIARSGTNTKYWTQIFTD